MSGNVTRERYHALYQSARDRWIAYCRRVVVQHRRGEGRERTELAFAIYDRRTLHLRTRRIVGRAPIMDMRAWRARLANLTTPVRRLPS